DGVETLTMTQIKVVAREGATTTITKSLRAPFTVARGASWCARTLGVTGDADCSLQFATDVFVPKSKPAGCEGRETVCAACQNHACTLVRKSTCELAGGLCFSSKEACET